ncbi:MAG: hypothetical protein QGG40_17585, partial [Myxococcota bacterium]|nr:hypothetical protein [Myxococcota bacterium]
SLLALAMLAYVGHYLVYCIVQPFFIEDAGISFAYARHLVEGEGLVPVRGGERVEGYSNALWTFVVAFFYGFGVPTWTSSKILGAVFGALTLPPIYQLTRRALPQLRSRETVSILPPFMLAASPQFVIWNASGLENSLFCMLLGLGLYRLVVESEDGGRPWSALWFLLLTMTRPEGLMYAAIALFARVVFAIADRRVGPVVSWVLLFGVGWVAYNAWRYWYFSWPFPNTYYAKLGSGNRFKPFRWTLGGWKYVINYMVTHGMVYGLPLLLAALVGLRRWRKWVWFTACLVLAGLILWDGREGLKPIPSWWRPWQKYWVEARVWTILACSIGAGLLTLGRAGWRSRAVTWATCASSIFFAIYVGGDWMKGHRWFNIVVITLFPLTALGLGVVLDAIPITTRKIRLPWIRRFLPVRPVLVLAPLAAFVTVAATQSAAFAANPETSVRDVNRRVNYMKWVQNRLDVDFVTLMDVDMGAHMFYSGWDIVDMAGLIDVPIARHRDYDKRFMKEYIFEERNPEFAHVHAGWARTTKIPQHKEWKERYIEVPGYPSGNKKLHVGNHVRRDLFITDDKAVPRDKIVQFDGGVRL